MTFFGPVALGTMARIGAGLGAALVVAYILKLRRRRFEVPFSKLWQRVLDEKETTSLWRKLKRLFSLLVQLAFVALLLGAALDPRRGEASSAGKSVVVIVDASASMQTLDEGAGAPTRMARARVEAHKLLLSLGGADTAMIVRMDGQTTALSRFETDVPRLVKIVDGIDASDTPADLHRALQAAADALRGRPNPLIVIIGDGAYPQETEADVLWDVIPTAGAGGAVASTPRAEPRLGQVDLRGIDVRFLPVGKDAPNVGIVAFNVRRYLANKLSYEVLVEVQNFSADARNVKLTLYAGGDAVDVKTLKLGAGERLRKIYPDLGGGDDRALRAEIQVVDDAGQLIPGADAFPLDDKAWALLPARRKQKVLLVSEDNLYLEGALLLDANVTVDKQRPADYPAALAKGELKGYDVAVFDGFTPDGAIPAAAAIYFDPRGDKSPFAIHGELPRPILTDINKDHPITRWVTLADVNIDRASVFVPQAGDAVLARSIRDPIVVAGRRDGKKLLAFGFGLDGTDLTLRVAFPILIVNALDWFAGDDAELITTYRTGHTWKIPVDEGLGLKEVTVTDPNEKRSQAPVFEGRASFYGRRVGVHRVDLGGGDSLLVAANLADPLESNVKPQAELALAGQKLAGAPTFKITASRQIWTYLALAALLLTTIEWWTYNRRITV